MKQLSTLAVLAFVCALAAPAPAQAGAEAQKVQRVLDARRRQGRPTDELVRELVGIGAGAAPVCVAILTGDLQGTDWQASGLTLEQVRQSSVSDELLLTEALRQLPPNAVGRALREACAGAAPLDRRLVGLHLLSDVGRDEQAVETWLALASGIEEIHLQRAYVRAQLEQALADCLKRSTTCFQALSKSTRTWERKLLPALVHSCAQAGRRQGVDVLANLCGIDRELDLALLAELPALVEASGGGLDELRVSWVCSFLADSDPLLRASAATGLGRVCDPDGAARLSNALSDPDPRVAQAALWSLRRISKLQLGAEREGWESWLSDEQRWHDEQHPGALLALEDADPARVVAGLHELAQHPLYRHESAAAIAGLEARTEPDLLLAVRAALRALGAPDLPREP